MSYRRVDNPGVYLGALAPPDGACLVQVREWPAVVRPLGRDAHRSERLGGGRVTLLGAEGARPSGWSPYA